MATDPRQALSDAAQPLAVPTAAGQPDAAGQAGGKRRWRLSEWGPPKAELEYTKEFVTVLVLVLALPWLLSKLLTNPGEVISAAGRKQVKP